MKKTFLALSVIFLVFAATSCMNMDDEETADNYFELMATVTSADDYPSFRTDEGFILNSTTKISSDTGAIFTIGDRFLLRCSYADTTNHVEKTYPVVIANYNKISIKAYRTIERDSVDTRIHKELYSMNYGTITNNYFNLFFRTYKPQKDPSSCELVRIKDDEPLSQGAEPVVCFELRHYTGALSYSYYLVNLCSFDLRPIRAEFPLASKIKVNLTWLDSNTQSASSILYYTPE